MVHELTISIIDEIYSMSFSQLSNLLLVGIESSLRIYSLNIEKNEEINQKIKNYDNISKNMKVSLSLIKTRCEFSKMYNNIIFSKYGDYIVSYGDQFVNIFC